MVIKRSLLIAATLILAVSASETTRAQEAQGVPDPRAWAQQLPESIFTATPGIIRSFTLALKDQTQDKKWAKATGKLFGLGFLQFVPSSALHYYRALNVGDDGVMPPEDPTLAAVPVQLLLKEDGARLNFQVMSAKGQMRSLGKFVPKKEDRASSEAFYRWLTSKFNYDAVVLDHKDEFILAAMLNTKTELGQGLLVKNSASKMLLKAGKIQGEALLQMLRIEGEFVIFESLLASGQTQKIPTGSKILLGQSEQLKQMMGPAGAAGGPPPPASSSSPAPAAPGPADADEKAEP